MGLSLHLVTGKLRGKPKSWDIRVYTDAMKIVKVRRVGNSNVVSIPRELEAHGYAPGTSVLVEELRGGELRILPTEQLRERIHTIGERVVAEHPEALKILAEHDPDSEPTPQ
jgi:antitoxin component of MazEF toxin-antitoxin module